MHFHTVFKRVHTVFKRVHTVFKRVHMIRDEHSHDASGADRVRVVEGISTAPWSAATSAQLGAVLRQLAPRWFVLRDTHVGRGPPSLHPRDTFSLLRGPMTRSEIRVALGRGAGAHPRLSQDSSLY